MDKKSIVFTSVLLSIMTGWNTAIAQNKPAWKIARAEKPEVIISDTVIRDQLPESLFGFNINYRTFQEQLWDVNRHQLKPGISNKLEAFGSNWYRYPGGIVGDSFDWTQSIGEVKKRQGQGTPYNKTPIRALFGLDEYLAFLKQVDGHRFYVLNLVGLDATNPMQESDPAEVAENNRKLAEYLLKNDPQDTDASYYQLGNELDRFEFEWLPDKYVKRSLATINAIKEVDTNARFVAFLRDFNWKYKQDPSLGVSTHSDFMRSVLDGLPMVRDYSLHHYYDGNRDDGKSREVPFWLKLMQRSIDTYRKIRNEDPHIWITEHARQKSSDKPGQDNTRFLVNNLNGAISTADYLTALAQIPQVQGAFRHAINAGPWQLFDHSSRHNDLRPLPIYWAMRLLKALALPVVLESVNKSSSRSGYKGGYDTRAVGFRDREHQKLGLWVINRQQKEVELDIRHTYFANKELEYCHYYIAADEDKDPDSWDLDPVFELSPLEQKILFDNKGLTSVILPPSSVSTFLIGENPACEPIK